AGRHHPSRPRLGVSLVGPGQVESRDVRVALTPTRRASLVDYRLGTEVVLRATPPAGGSYTVSWSDHPSACGGPTAAPAECRLRMDRDHNLTVRFIARP
ncbi:MAG TPA: hypothetical protein PKU97_14995, partial [Kofleriaceae bacterium]|nr:hypothetical protein [Kofleriaceae bacterium]